MNGVTRIAALACAVLLTGTAPRQEQSVELRSPDGRTILVAGVLQDTDGHCGYALAHDGRTILLPSAFALTFRDEPAFGEHLRVAAVTRSRAAGQWNPVYGERRVVPDSYNQVVLSLSETRPPHRAVEMTFRAYNEGVAFQYVVQPSEGRRESVLLEERSRFVFEQDFPAWVVPAAQGRYERLPISAMGNDRERPLVVEMGAGLHVALGEAKLVDFARMKFSAVAGPSPALESRLSGEVRLALPAASPWRYVMIGASPAQLLERNYLVLNLNDPPAIGDVSWIKPGKVIRDVTLTTQGGLACVDFAAARGLQYVEFDAGWYGPEDSESSSALAVDVDPRRSAGPLDLPRLIQYAESKRIGVILYVNRRALERQIDDILPLYRSWGVKGLKFGFVQVGSQRWTSWVHEAVRKAAAHRLMVDVHDEYRPTGYERTYPNLMTVEGIRGDEESPDNRHTLITLFTRMLAGAGDNTICYFAPRVRTMGSHASQLAKSVLLYSPWQFLYWYDRPAASPRQAGGAGSSDGVIGEEPELDFFDALPVTWDDTKVLEGKIGEYATMARRKGQQWFVASLTGEQGRAVEIPLSFLEEGRQYTAVLYFDDAQVQTRTGVRREERRVVSSTVLRHALGRNQGLAVVIRPR
ncbi:MAG: glycoside hydrolase family 97 protein [Vicinamibacterales bacterium]|jgi:alpha-glucosidase|nr:glycoside hydrolase family 97 protein [Vicinamibacterales bacterium]